MCYELTKFVRGFVLGVFLKNDLALMGVSDEERAETVRMRDLLRRLVDSMGAFIFLHSWNVARVETDLNLGMGVSLAAIRGLVGKYIASKNHNITHKRESPAQQIRTKANLEIVKNHWCSEGKVDDFIRIVKNEIDDWWGKVRTGKLCVAFFCLFLYFCFGLD